MESTQFNNEEEKPQLPRLMKYCIQNPNKFLFSEYDYLQNFSDEFVMDARIVRNKLVLQCHKFLTKLSQKHTGIREKTASLFYFYNATCVQTHLAT